VLKINWWYNPEIKYFNNLHIKGGEMGAEVKKCVCLMRPDIVAEIKMLGSVNVCETGCNLFQRGGFVVLNERGEVSTCGIDKLEISEVAKMRTNKAYLVE
jgi:hypothetical protein